MDIALVVGRDGHVDVLQGRVRVAEGDHGEVHVGRLFDGLAVGPRVCDDEEARLLELLRDLVREGARGETPRDGLGPRVLRELQNAALARARRDCDDVRALMPR